MNTLLDFGVSPPGQGVHLSAQDLIFPEACLVDPRLIQIDELLRASTGDGGGCWASFQNQLQTLQTAAHGFLVFQLLGNIAEYQDNPFW